MAFGAWRLSLSVMSSGSAISFSPSKDSPGGSNVRPAARKETSGAVGPEMCRSRLKALLGAIGRAGREPGRGPGCPGQLCSERLRAGQSLRTVRSLPREGSQQAQGPSDWLTLPCPLGVQRLRGRPAEYGQRLDRDSGHQCPLPRPERRAKEAELCMGLGSQALGRGTWVVQEGSDGLPGRGQVWGLQGSELCPEGTKGRPEGTNRGLEQVRARWGPWDGVLLGPPQARIRGDVFIHLYGDTVPRI